MPRTSTESSEKWQREQIQAIPRAEKNFKAALPTIARKLLAEKATMIREYTAKLNSPEYAASVNAGFAVGKTDVAYKESMDQIIESGYTQSQRNKVKDVTDLRRALTLQLPGVLLLSAGRNGQLKFPTGLGEQDKKIILNKLIQKYSGEFSPTTTAAEIVVVILSHKAEIPSITAGTG